MEGYQSLKPPDEHVKHPFSEYHTQKILKYCVDINKYASLLPGCAISIKCYLPLRPGEVRYKPKSDGKDLHDEFPHMIFKI